MQDDNQKRSRDAAVDENLRRVFQPTLEEEVPDRFTALLKQLKEKEQSGNSGDDA